ARLAMHGHAVAIVDLTRGEAASRGSVQERADEAAAAANVLGVAARENLELPDLGIDRSDRGQLSAVVACLRRHPPPLPRRAPPPRPCRGGGCARARLLCPGARALGGGSGAPSRAVAQRALPERRRAATRRRRERSVGAEDARARMPQEPARSGARTRDVP